MKFSVFIVLCAASWILCGADVKLTDNGKPACVIVVKPDASVVEKHAASELAVYLGRISGGKAPSVTAKPQKGMTNVSFSLTELNKVDDEGFLIRTAKNNVFICAKEPVGFLYGVYDILKRYGGIRWLVPGDDGEYFKIRKTISIPEGEYVSNPSFKFRNINWCSAGIRSPKWASFDWMLRNGLRIFEPSAVILDRGLNAKLMERAAVIQAGGHCFSDLLGGSELDYHGKSPYQQLQANLRKMYREHPDYFPLINGKRVFLDGQKYQPCSSNPEVIRIMSRNLVRYLNEFCSRTPGGRYRLVNNDGTGWCQCENCLKLDRGSKLRTNRYWTFMNAIAEQVFKEKPDAILNTIAYQDFETAPTEIFPDKRFATVELSFNRICYRHRLDDPDCLTNRKYYRQHKEWEALSKKRGFPVVTYGQIDTMGCAFMPIEDVYPHDMRLYYKMGIRGIRPQIPPPDGIYGKRYDNSPMTKLCWYGMWQTLYLFAAQAWNIETNTDELCEEINRLYYGEKAWNAGMKDFRRLLSRSFRETPGCYGHGHSSPLGRCMDRPGVREELNKYLYAAEKAAASDPDKRALMHVMRERKIFLLTWEKFREDYQKSYREIRSYRKTQPIRIDGVLDEFDWKNADTVSGFKVCGNDPRPAKDQTFVRVVHEPENIYFGVECMEPLPNRLMENIRKHDGPVWEDNTVEFFLNHPDLGNAYYQIIVSSAGVVFDQLVRPGSPADRSYHSQIEVKTRKLKDRWILECRIPTAPVGEKCFDGQSWKINVLRSRKIAGTVTRSGIPNESSTWSIGYPHNVGVFLPVNFCAGRKVDYGHEQDVRVWRNGSFNELAKKKYPGSKNYVIRDGLLPMYWAPAGRNVSLSLESDPADVKSRFLRLRGIITNDYLGRSKKVKLRVRVRGEGRLYFAWYCYDEVKGRRVHRKSVNFHEETVSAKDWTYLSFTSDLPDYAVTKFAVNAVPKAKDGFMDIDEIYIMPSDPGKK